MLQISESHSRGGDSESTEELKNDDDEKTIIEAFRKHYPNEGIFPETYLARGSSTLVNKLSEGMHKGITASCSGFYGPQMRELRLKPSRPYMIDKLSSFRSGKNRVTNFEMETGAMFGLAKLLGHHCCAVNLIVANRIAQQYSKNAEAKMHEMIQIVLDRI